MSGQQQSTIDALKAQGRVAVCDYCGFELIASEPILPDEGLCDVCCAGKLLRVEVAAHAE
jgi:hypothetical protein